MLAILKFGTIFKLRFLTLLFLLVYSNLSFALGLSDVELKSHLGEKLIAKVHVSDLQAESEASCFTASDVSDTPGFKKATVSLQPTSAGHQLLITSNDVVTEPIVNLRVAYHCEPNVVREYVLLLDPAPLPNVEKTSTDNTAQTNQENLAVNAKRANPPVSKKQAPQIDTAQQNTNTEEALTEKPIKKIIKKKKKIKVASVDDKLSEAYTGTPTTDVRLEKKVVAENPLANASENKPKAADKPFLIISAGDASAGENVEKSSLSLRLATEIDFNRPQAVLDSTSTTDAMDEVTVMANRLSHLEKQIASLQTRNAKLVADAVKTKEEKEAFNWQSILFMVFGILAVLAVTEWLRRKFFNRDEKNQAAEWFDNELDNDTEELMAPLTAINVENSQTYEQQRTEPSFTEPPSAITSFENRKPDIPIEKENHESVLDDANVFIEHGRPALAVQLLQNHLSESPAESPAIWFKLLNLLAKENSETDYDEAVVECNKYFNIKASRFGDTSEKGDSSIEDYPHIISRLEGVWGSQYAVGFLNDVIYNKRSQPREGLEQNAFEDLFFLKTIATYLASSNSDTPMLPSQQASFHPAVSTQPVFENASFNDALFNDIEPLNETKASPNQSQNNIEFDTEIAYTNPSSKLTHDAISEKSGFHDASLKDDVTLKLDNDSYNTAPTLETGTLLNAESITHADNLPIETITFDFLQESPSLDADESFHAEEIDFSVHSEEIEITATLESLAMSRANDESAEQAPVKSKTKAKTDTKKQTGTNSIEWDLPEIAPKSKK